MREVYYLARKSWRFLSYVFIIVLILSFISPASATPKSSSVYPNPIYPSNHAYTNPDTDPPLGIPSFNWSAVSGANSYRLQVDSEI
jgi:hypothetical protein